MATIGALITRVYQNFRGVDFLNDASKLDVLTKGYGKISQYATTIVENQDEVSTIMLLKKISELIGLFKKDDVSFFENLIDITFKKVTEEERKAIAIAKPLISISDCLYAKGFPSAISI